MPRKTKETNEIIKTAKPGKTTDVAKKGTKKTTAKSTKSIAKKTSTKKEAVAKLEAKTKKASTNTVAKKTSATSKTVASKSTTAKKAFSKASATKTSTKRSTTTKKKTATKLSSKKAVTKKKTNTVKKQKVDIVEYYDLPYRYNQTIVKVLAQTPNNLFIYWDISDKDRETYKAQYGEKCDYKIELGRRPIKENPKIHTDYIYITTSNEIESPNDHILFKKEQKTVYFRNVKTGVQIEKPISANSFFVRNMGKIYNIYDIYKAIYQNEDIEEIYDLSNPSSGNPSSGSLSSKFK